MPGGSFSPKVAEADLFRAGGIPVRPVRFEPGICQGPPGCQDDCGTQHADLPSRPRANYSPGCSGRIYDSNRIPSAPEQQKPCKRAGSIYDKLGAMAASYLRDATLAGGEDLGQMTSLNRYTLAMERSAELHQTSAIVANHCLSAAFLQPDDLILRHRQRDVRKLDREHPAEATTFFRIAELDQLQISHPGQQDAWFVADTQFAHQMA
jgi:hypothetical protein